jgi:hypothetical protein
VKLLEPTLQEMPGRLLPKLKRLILDPGYDSDPLRLRLRERGIEMICPHRRNRKEPKTQDGRKLRRYKRRSKVERRLVWQLSPLAGALGTQLGCVSRIFPSRVCLNYIEQVLKPPLIKNGFAA